MIYAIIPFEKDKDLTEEVKKIDGNAYVDYAPTIYFLSYNGSGAEVMGHLGFSSKQKPPTSGIVIRVDLYGGHGNSELWEWLSNHMAQEV